MQISFAQFKSAVVTVHAANKNNNLHISIFASTRALVVAYAKSTPNWRAHVTKKQANDTIPLCIALDKDYNSVCEELGLN